VSPRSSSANLRGFLTNFRNSAEKGLEEKEYEFDAELFEEIVPEVRVSPYCVVLPPITESCG